MKSNNEKERTIRRFLDNLYTKEEAEEFFRDVKDRRNDTLTDNIIWELEEETGLQKTSDAVSYQQYKQEAWQLLKRLEKKKRIRFRRVAVYIAAMASVLFLGLYIFHYVKMTELSSVLYTETVTSYGEKRRLVFPDSTRVVLNSRTNIAYPDNFGKNERRIKLSGEAYFDVSKDKTPFIVETECFDVRVLGTAFNVKVYDKDEIVSVAVNEGRVEVSMAEATLVLKPKEKITLNTRTGEIMKEIVRNDGHSFAWIEGWLYFDRTPIRDIARELERIYGCRIVFKEGQEFNNLISGEHDNQSLESVLRSIEYTSGIKYIKKDNEVLLYK
ncbi:FecR domain-containing protein [uncultured Proteiniphilum sp.]|uniref:FecR family protein n=1 Tax=uncultured Proteiniphilum sp. TaxID=497637 RepID=UPI00261A2BDF|nr:FecR domain-containing protein [uncultured Proteiniphilum sp.]